MAFFAVTSRDRSKRPGEVAHVCFFPGALTLGGVGRVMVNLAREMLGRGIRVDFFLTRSPKDVAVYQSQIPDGARVFYGSTSVGRSLTALVTYLRVERPDAIIGARERINIASVIAARLAGRHTKVIASSHTNRTAEIAAQGGATFRSRWLDILARWLYPRAHAHVAVSLGVAQDVERRVGFPQRSTRVIYNPIVDASLFAKSEQRPVHPWLADAKLKVVTGIGRLTMQKNFSLLVQAFAFVHNQDPSARLLLLGEGEERDRLASLVRTLRLEDVVHLAGYVANPFADLRRSRLFVLSSDWEGFGNVLVEALALGVPVVATDCPSGPREILDEGRFGQLVPVNDVNALANAILRGLSAPVDSDALRARGAEFSVERASDAYLSIIAGSRRMA